ncbi:hypothetical protein K502DRAFT_327838 [Neoconidiobolus thromboides FSU 785]|nr:hypothetical protein K502DRAFT_327838 [Neoconidiobolus thromboides FSU 785]
MRFFVLILSVFYLSIINADIGDDVLNSFKQILNFNADHMCFNGFGKFVCRLQTGAQKAAISFISRGVLSFNRNKCCPSYRNLIKNIGSENNSFANTTWNTIDDCFDFNISKIIDKIKDKDEVKSEKTKNKLKDIAKDNGKNVLKSVAMDYAKEFASAFVPDSIRDILGDPKDDICSPPPPSCIDKFRTHLKTYSPVYWLKSKYAIDNHVVYKNHLTITSHDDGFNTSLNQTNLLNICKLSQSEMWTLINELQNNKDLLSYCENDILCPTPKCLSMVRDKNDKSFRNLLTRIFTNSVNNAVSSNKNTGGFTAQIYPETIAVEFMFSNDSKSNIEATCLRALNRIIDNNKSLTTYIANEINNTSECHIELYCTT